MNAELIMIAIQAGVRLYAAGHRAYTEATLGNSLILPLPRGPGITKESARTFFMDTAQGQSIAKGSDLIKSLCAAVGNGTISSDGEKQLNHIYLAYAKEMHLIDEIPEATSADPAGREIVAILTIGQWSKGEPGHPSGLQLIAGTLVNIAVDYFISVPGAISDNRPVGRALKTFLEALDKVDMASIPPADIAGDLLIAVVDSVAANPDIAGSSETEKKLIQNVAKTLSASAASHLKNEATDERWKGSAWLQMIARAMIKGGADTILADPSAALGISEAEGGFVKEIGITVADLMIGKDKVTFQPLMSGEGLNTVMKAALRAAAKNPGIFRTDNQGMKNILAGVADGLSSQPNLITGDIFPEIARLVLEKSGDNLDLLWPKGASDPGSHLLITATKQLFKALDKGTSGNKWPTLTKEQILNIAELVFAEVVENPDWLIAKAELANNSALEAAVHAALASLQAQKTRLSADAAVGAVKAAIKACALRLDLLRTLPAGGADAGKVAISAAIDSIFESAFGKDVSADDKWLRARNSSLTAVLEVALDKLARAGAQQKQIDILRRETGKLIDKRMSLEEFGDQLEQELLAA